MGEGKRGNHWSQEKEEDESSREPKSKMTWPLRRLKKRPLVSRLTFRSKKASIHSRIIRRLIIKSNSNGLRL